MTEIYKDGKRVVSQFDDLTTPTPITRRDRFAIAALTGLLANNDASGIPLAFAVMSYELADAMELVRNKEGGE